MLKHFRKPGVLFYFVLMLNLSDIIKLGDPRLREKCDPVIFQEVETLESIIQEMFNLIIQFRTKWGAGRAIAAPQIGCLKRFICLNIDTPRVFFNPQLLNKSEEKIELWDDCMSFPNLIVKLKRHKKCTLFYKDENWIDQKWEIEDDLSELMQHEVDHLNGVLAIDRALDKYAFKWRDLKS